MIRRPPRSTLSSSSAASDVYKRQTYDRLKESNKNLKACVIAVRRADCFWHKLRAQIILVEDVIWNSAEGHPPVFYHSIDEPPQHSPTLVSQCRGSGSWWWIRATAEWWWLSLIHISEPTRLLSISYAVFCLKKKKKNN
eukprot:TRINITY_DN44940_c0_g1_i2.p1 TRINITY_DN44940_c0_g1~~TRINITY_DN44940_c0_g1_i2.p1  ORF type:complete len:139 (+),score=45.11 TRINITY_DN44940_c0_g1_i2:72-488(+)